MILFRCCNQIRIEKKEKKIKRIKKIKKIKKKKERNSTYWYYKNIEKSIEDHLAALIHDQVLDIQEEKKSKITLIFKRTKRSYSNHKEKERERERERDNKHDKTNNR